MLLKLIQKYIHCSIASKGFELPDVSGDDEFIYPYESINSKISIFRKKTRQTMDNICQGKFP